MRSQSFFAALFVAVLTMPALAQNPPASPPTRIRGTVEKLDGQVLTVKSREGEEVTVTLAPNVTIRYLVKKSLADIKAGDFVASTSMKGTDDLAPESLMTNATVSGVTGAPQGQTLKVTYKGGESELVVGPDTPIFGYGAGDMSLLKPGAAVFIVAPKKPDGSLTAAGVTAEKDGVKPPM